MILKKMNVLTLASRNIYQNWQRSLVTTMTTRGRLGLLYDGI